METFKLRNRRNIGREEEEPHLFVRKLLLSSTLRKEQKEKWCVGNRRASSGRQKTRSDWRVFHTPPEIPYVGIRILGERACGGESERRSRNPSYYIVSSTNVIKWTFQIEFRTTLPANVGQQLLLSFPLDNNNNTEWRGGSKEQTKTGKWGAEWR